MRSTMHIAAARVENGEEINSSEWNTNERMLRVASLALLFYSLLLNEARAAVVSLNPVADAYIREFSPDINFGGEPSVVSGLLGDRAAFEIRRALLRFDLAGQVPPGAVIQSATLTLTVTMMPA